MRAHVIVLLTLILTTTADAQTDSTARWPVGSRVRISTVANRQVIGSLTEVRDDTLVIREEGRVFVGWAWIPVDSVARIELARRRGVSASRVLGSAAIGAAATPLVMLAVSEAWKVGERCRDCSSEGGWRGKHYAVGALVGGGVGALLGARKRVDHWEDASAGMRIGVVPTRGGAWFALELPFR